MNLIQLNVIIYLKKYSTIFKENIMEALITLYTRSVGIEAEKLQMIEDIEDFAFGLLLMLSENVIYNARGFLIE